MGPVYHIDHDGSFINTKHTYQPGFADAPFGPDWASGRRHWNREDWGVRAAIDDPQGDTTWLRTPEESGPTLSLVLHGRAMWRRASPRSTVCSHLPAASIELLVVDPSPALASALASRQDPRLRTIAAPDPPRARAPAAAMRTASCCARGRHLVYLPGPVVIDGLDRLVARLDRLGAEASGPIVHAIEAVQAPVRAR